MAEPLKERNLNLRIRLKKINQEESAEKKLKIKLDNHKPIFRELGKVAEVNESAELGYSDFEGEADPYFDDKENQQTMCNSFDFSNRINLDEITDLNDSAIPNETPTSEITKVVVMSAESQLSALKSQKSLMNLELSKLQAYLKSLETLSVSQIESQGKKDIAICNFLKSEIDYLSVELKGIEVQNVQAKYKLQTKQKQVERVTKDLVEMQQKLQRVEWEIDDLNIELQVKFQGKLYVEISEAGYLVVRQVLKEISTEEQLKNEWRKKVMLGMCMRMGKKLKQRRVRMVMQRLSEGICFARLLKQIYKVGSVVVDMSQRDVFVKEQRKHLEQYNVRKLIRVYTEKVHMHKREFFAFWRMETFEAASINAGIVKLTKVIYNTSQLE